MDDVACFGKALKHEALIGGSVGLLATLLGSHSGFTPMQAAAVEMFFSVLWPHIPPQ